MRYFELTHPRSQVPRKWSGRYTAKHPWRLPGFECPACGVTWSGDLALPDVDLSELPEREELRDADFASFEDYKRLAEKIRPLLPVGVSPVPGMQFGGLSGSVRGQFGPITMGLPWEGLIREDALAHLSAAGLRGVQGVRTQLQGRGGSNPALFELAPLLAGQMDPACVLEEGTPCETCGRRETSIAPHCWLDKAALPDELDLFRPMNAETYIIVSERFRETVSHLESSDIVFSEIGVGGRATQRV